MAYTPELKQLIRKVEQTRPLRLAKKGEGWEFPKMSLAENRNRTEIGVRSLMLIF